jgi:hypothetical protein
MRSLRPVIALNPRLFGRRFPGFIPSDEPAESGAGSDLQLFAQCFAVGFLFVAVLIF